jgi:RNA polymerase sigma-70 factor (ECF subfamily)
MLVRDADDDRTQRELRFRALYQEHYASIRAYAVRRLASAEDVADVVAETFTAAWRRLGEVPSPPADRLWLYGVARRVVAGRRRSLRRSRNLLARLAASQGRPGEALSPARCCHRIELDPACSCLMLAKSLLLSAVYAINTFALRP